MDYDLSPSQTLLQESARAFVQRQCAPAHVRELMDTDVAFDEQLWQGIAEQGWIGMHLPEEQGGLGLGVVEMAVVAEEMGRGCVPGPFLSVNWAATLLSAAGSLAWCGRYLPDITAGSVKATVAFLEEQANWDVAALEMPAVNAVDGLNLNGTKTMVLNANIADLIVWVARLDHELVLAAVPARAVGLQLQNTPGIDRTRPLGEVRMMDVNVPSDQIVAMGEVAQQALHRASLTAAVITCAELVGAMQWMLDTSVEYAKTRTQFGQPIGAFQAVQHQCADMLLMTDSARSATYYAAWALEEDAASADAAVSVAKAYCSDGAREVANRAVQIHGGIGFTWEHDLHMYYKRVRASEYLFGDATFHRERLAKELVGTTV